MWKTATILTGVVLALLALGLVMVGSASRIKGELGKYQDPYYFLKRQIVWLAFAAIAGIAASHFDYRLLRPRTVAWSLAGVSIALLLLVLIPGIGGRIGGSRRWFVLAGFSFQPSELSKVAVAALLAAHMTAVRLRAEDFKEGFLLPLLPLGIVTGLIFLEPDYGTAFLVAVVGMLVMFVGGSRVKYLAVTATVGFCGFLLAVMQDPVRMARLLAFLFPEKHKEIAYHLRRSMYAFIMGDVFGVGLNKSMEKHLYLPEAHTDFIFAIVGEELGFVGTVSVLAGFLVILFCGLRISARCEDPFGRLLALAVTVMIVLQAIMNIAVVTGCMPTKGISLPFISYGGSSLVMSVAGVGLLVSIARRARD